MDKYKLNKNNKYLGQVEIKNIGIVFKLCIKRNIIRIFSVTWALQLLFVGMNEFGKIMARYSDINYMYENFYLDTESVNNELKMNKGKYEQIEDKYNNMTDEEKNNFVVFIFNNLIDNIDEFSEEEKEYLKEREGILLKQYGHHYYFENIFDMTSRLRRLIVKKNVDLEDGIGGFFDSSLNEIVMDTDMSNASLSHEVEHAITINHQKLPNFYNYDVVMGLHYLDESMDSSSDLTFHGVSSYFSRMRTHMLFLSKIVGRENLLKYYFNHDFKLLEKILKDDYEELMMLSGKQIELLYEKVFDLRYCNEIADKLKDIYENNTGCSIEDDELMRSLYEASKGDSNICFNSTLFDDYLNFDKKILIHFFDGNRYDFFNCNCDYNGENFSVRNGMNKYDTNTDNMRARKLNYFLPNIVIDKMVNGDNQYGQYGYLKLYLEELGVSNSEYWAYNLYNNAFPVFCSSDIYNYDRNCFKNDLRIILKEKYYELEDKDRISSFYYGFDVFFFDKNNVSDDKFISFYYEDLGFDKDRIDTDINSNLREEKSNGNSK